MSYPISVGILTFNNSKTLARALESVREFDDIIICDGGSTDDTLEIAAKYNARIISQSKEHLNPNNTIADFAKVRNQTLALARHEWFCFIDSDEYLSEEAMHEMGAIAQKKPVTVEAYQLPRKRIYQDRVVECSTTYPSYQMRFFRIPATNGFIKSVHERIDLKPGVQVGYLSACEYVPFEFTYEAWRKKLLYYLSIEVKRHAHITVTHWLTHTVVSNARASLAYAIKLLIMLVRCRGHHMPLWYELMQHWYHWKLIALTGAKFLRPKHERDAG